MASYDEQILGAKEQAATARKLRESIQDPTGQMVSGWYVAPSATQHMSSALAKVLSGWQERKANEKLDSIRQQRDDETKALMSQIYPQQTGEGTLGQDSKMPGYDPQAQKLAMIVRGMQTNREAFEPMLKAEEFNLAQQARKDAQQAQLEDRQTQRQWQAEQQQIAREQQFQQQRNMAQLAASLRPAPQPRQDPLVQVMGPDNVPVYMPSSQAVGARPYTAQTAKQEQVDIMRAQQKGQAALSAQQVLDQAAVLNAHPGRQLATGASSFMSAIPGTDAKGFKANLDTFKAETFIPMVSALKGTGALSDAEGKKLSDSVGALDPSMPEEEFQKSLQDVAQRLYKNAKISGLNVSLPEFAASKPKNGASGSWGDSKQQNNPQENNGGLQVGAVVDGYKYLGGDPKDPKSWGQ
jgi:hypothetical protein